jgi:prepilin-type N-terminal cleavage/methylation domain-containing protein
MSSPSPSASTRRSGFTIVELLVVMAIIATLMALLLVGLQAARRTSKVTSERNNLSQVYKAWMQYAGSHDDSALPGYIDPSVQENNWRVKYKAKDGTNIPPDYAALYPHRLLSYLDHSFPVLYDYLEADDDDFFRATLPDSSFNTAGVETMALSPAFGYNGYYLGGYWRSVNGAPNLRFGNATWDNAAGNEVIGKVVATKTSNVADPSRMIVFCSAASRGPGLYKKDGESDLGASLVVPHILAETNIWAPSDGTNFGAVQTSSASLLSYFPTLATSFTLTQGGGTAIEVLASGTFGVPHRRFANQVQVVHVDGSTIGAGLGELLDQSRWMNPAFEAANRTTFTHTDPAQ